MPNQFNVTFPVKHLLIKQLHDLTQKLSLSLYGHSLSKIISEMNYSFPHHLSIFTKTKIRCFRNKRCLSNFITPFKPLLHNGYSILQLTQILSTNQYYTAAKGTFSPQQQELQRTLHFMLCAAFFF